MKKLLLAVLLLVSIGSRAQTLSMGQLAPAIDQDTIQNGHLDTAYVWVKNTDTSSYTGNFDVYGAVRNAGNPAILDSNMVLYSSPPVTILGDDSLLVQLIIQYTVYPQIYRYGIDVIVVWPVATGALTLDSLEYTIFIEDPSAGVSELDMQQIIRLYPNPSSEQISVDCNGLAEIREINIYDMSGKLVLARKNESCMDIRVLAPGMYTIDVVLAGNKHYSFKFLRQKNSSE